MVYWELHERAGAYMRHERRAVTLETTVLVNEAWLRIADTSNVEWRDRAHFFAVAAQMMRRILVDAARGRVRDKRGGHAERVNLDQIPDISCRRDSEILAIDDALERLAEVDPRKVRVIELRFFGGLSIEDTAAVLNISGQSVMRDWRLAKSWLMREIKPPRKD
jgi:RNA polymerase sigma factor (TIGR02999 family)